MGEYTTVEKAKRLIHAYLEDDLPADDSNNIVAVAYEYLGLISVLGDLFLSNTAFHCCIAQCRDAEKRVRALYDNYIAVNHD